MALKLYFDECENARVIAGVRRRGIDCTTANDQGLLGASDEVHLDRATKLGCVIVTGDVDFLALAKARIEAGQPFPGLIFVANRAPIGRAVAALELAAIGLDPADMVNWIEWV